MANDNDKKDDGWDDDNNDTNANELSPREAMRLGQAAFRGKQETTEAVSPQRKAANVAPSEQISDADRQAIQQFLAAFNIQVSFEAQKINISKQLSNNLRVNAILMQHGLVDKKIPNFVKVKEWLNDQNKQNAFKAALDAVLNGEEHEIAASPTTAEPLKEEVVAPRPANASVVKSTSAQQVRSPWSDAELKKLAARRAVIADESPTLSIPSRGLPPLPSTPVTSSSRLPEEPSVKEVSLSPVLGASLPPLPATPAAVLVPPAPPISGNAPMSGKELRIAKVEEFGRTEDSYLSSLQFMLDNKQRIFSKPVFKNLKRPQKQVVSEMIELIEQIVKMNEELQSEFKTLHAEMAKDPEDPVRIQNSLNKIAQMIGPVTQLHNQYFTLFENQYSSMLKDPALKEKLDALAKFNVSQKENEILEFGSYLIMPVQRGLRYADMFKALEKEIAPSSPYYNDVINIRPVIEQTIREANDKLREARSKTLRNSIYEGKISLPLLQEYARAKIDEENANDDDSIKAIQKRIKRLEAANPVLPKVHHQFAELNLTWRIDLFKPADEIGVTFPAFHSREKSSLSRPAVETRGDIQVNVNIENSAERRAIKSRLRYAEKDIMAALTSLGLPGGLKIVAAKKELGVKADFIVQDQNNNNIVQIVVDRDQLRIRELKGEHISDDAKLALIHALTHAIKADTADPVVVSDNLDKIRRLNEIAVNAHGETYAQSMEDKRHLHRQIESDNRSHTSRMLYPNVEIITAGKKLEEVKNSLVKIIEQGSFVPKLVNPNSDVLTLFSGEVTIKTDIPLLAIKQYNAALEVGMTPKFTKEAKKKVDDFVKKQLNNNRNDTQITMDVPLRSTQITGSQVLQRLTHASNDGFVATLNPQAQSALRDHIGTLAADHPSLEYALPQGHSHSAELVNSLISKGLLPNIEALGDGRELRQILRENALANPGLLIVDSGSQARDFHVLKTATEDLGMKLGISVTNIKRMRQEVAKGELHTIDFKNIPIKQQVDYAKQLAEYGVFANFTAPVQQGENILIKSNNASHLRVMFEKYLNQGFLPTCNDRIKELSENGAYIKIEGNDPKILWERMVHCSKSGLKIQLSPEQVALMKKFSERHNPALPIHGHSWGTVQYNIELANQLGMSIAGLSEHAQAAYFRAQATEKQNGRAMPVIDIQPIQVTEKRFLRRDRQVNDQDKTKQFAEMLLKFGVNLSVNALADMKKDAEKESKKTKWFGLSKTPTDKAVKAQLFLQNVKVIESNIQTQASSFAQASVASLEAKANGLAPDSKAVKATKSATVVPIVSAETASNRQQFLPSDGARVTPVPFASPVTSTVQELTLDEAISKFKAIREKARNDFDFKIDYKNPTRVYDNAEKICTALDQIKADSSVQQMVNLRHLFTDIANGNHGLLGGAKPRGYTLDESIKAEAKALLDRLSVASKPSMKPSGGST